MAVLPILRWPDPRLSRPSAPLGTVDEGVRRLAADMLETMYAAPGRGLAAPQVGVLRRLFVMDMAWKTGAPDPHVFVDPEIVWMAHATIPTEEGCLSIPGVTVALRRSERLRLVWNGLDGRARSADFDGFAAICIQHELDHLDGRVTFDRLDPGARAAAEAAYRAVPA